MSRQVRAVKSFQSRYGFIRAGAIFTSEPNYADELERIGLIVTLPDNGPQPDRVQAFARAPHLAGKELTPESPPPSSSLTSAAALDDGPAPPSPSLRAAPARRKRMQPGVERAPKPS